MDARIPEKWLSDRRLVRLSDAGYRLFITSLLWSVSNRTDGWIGEDDLPLLPHVDRGCTGELVAVELWLRDRDGDGWLILDFSVTQSSRDELDALDRTRKASRERKARQRSRERKSRDRHGDSHVTGVTGTAQARQGKARRS